MEPRTAHSFYNAWRGDKCVFVYSGAFHDEHTAMLIALGEAAVGDGEGKGGARGRLAFIMVEAYQNIIRHRAALPPRLEQGVGRSLFLLRCGTAGQQLVVAVNPVQKEEAAGLRKALQQLRGMDAAQLKNLFLSGLQRTTDQPRRGAGLGLIEMARRSGSELVHSLSDVDEGHELFTLAVRSGAGHAYDEVIPETAALHARVVQQDLLLLHVGERPVGVQEAVLRMVEEEVVERTARTDMRGRAYLAANGSFGSGADDTGRRICALTREGEHNGLAVGREMDQRAANELAERIRMIGGLDRSELDRRYRNALLKRGPSEEGADLLDLARISVEPLETGVFPMEEGGGNALMVIRALF